MSWRVQFETEGEAIENIFERLNDLERGGHPFRWDPDTRELFYVVPRTGEEVLVCTEDCCPCGTDCNAPSIRSLGIQEFSGSVSDPFTFAAPPVTETGDLIVMDAQLSSCDLLDAPDNLELGGGWSRLLSRCHDAAGILVHSAFNPGGYDWTWDPVVTEQFVGLSVAITSAGGVGQFASKDSDLDGFSGSSNLPTVTTTLPNSMILYGINSSGFDANFGSAVPGLIYVGSQAFSNTTHLLYEIQAEAGPSTQRTVEYANGSFRTEWALVIDPLCAPTV